MKNVFISQPMNGKKDKEIRLERQQAIKDIRLLLKEDINVIDSFLTKTPKDATPLWYLGESLKLMSYADIVVFLPHWQDYRGCIIEHLCAKKYNFDIIEL